MSEPAGKEPRKKKGQSAAVLEEERPAPASLDRVREMLAPLGRPEKSRLFEMIRQGHLQNEQMGPHVARVLIELLNGSRTEHARRLWTGWFDPILLRDDVTLLAETRPFTGLHVVDAGAWWFALAGTLETLAGEIQAGAAALGREQPLERVFASPEARTWSERLRRQTLAVLADHRGKPAATARLVANANLHRARLIKDRGLPCLTALTPADLATLEFLLELAPAWGRLGGSALTADPAELLLVSMALVHDDAVPPEGASLLALARVHASRDPDFAAQVYRTFALAPVREAIVEHFQFAAQLLRQWLEHHYLAQPGPLNDVLLRLPAATLLNRLFGWYDTAVAADTGRDERLRSLVNTTLSRAISLVEDRLVPSVSQRILGMTPRTSPHANIERVTFIAAFHAGFTQRGIATVDKPWVPAVGEHVAGLFQSLAGTCAQDPKPGQDLPALARLVELAGMVGARVGITTLNTALITVVTAGLEGCDRFDPGELPLLERVIAVAREERRRSKWWVTPEIKRLLEVAEKRGLSAAGPDRSRNG